MKTPLHANKSLKNHASSTDIIKASWLALKDAVEYKLYDKQW